MFDDLPRTLLEVKPTVFVGVPRVYEKIHNQILHKTQGTKRKIFDWALSVGQKYREQVLNDQIPECAVVEIGEQTGVLEDPGRRGRPGAAVYFRWSAAWARNWQRGMPTSAFASMKATDLTETSPVIAINTQQNHRLGTVGKTLVEP